MEAAGRDRLPALEAVEVGVVGVVVRDVVGVGAPCFGLGKEVVLPLDEALARGTELVLDVRRPGIVLDLEPFRHALVVGACLDLGEPLLDVALGLAPAHLDARLKRGVDVRQVEELEPWAAQEARGRADLGDAVVVVVGERHVGECPVEQVGNQDRVGQAKLLLSGVHVGLPPWGIVGYKREYVVT